MVIAKQMDIRANIKKYFDMAYNGEPVVVPRKENKNVIIISESLYNELTMANRLSTYATAVESISDSDLYQNKEVCSDVRFFNEQKLQVIAGLKDNWNGNGAQAFKGELIVRVRDILDHLDIQPQIFPTALMTIQLEFDNSRRDHMEIEIGTGDTAEVFLVRYDGSEIFEDIAVDHSIINKRVKAFYG